jgi:3-oxoacyl-[acyl-carrier protein] reductase
MDLGIKGRVAMVAAASKGLGRATAEALASEGCTISVCSRSKPDFGDLAVACDVTKAADLQRWYEATVEHFGQVDIVVTNTGGPPAAPFLKLTEDQWQQGIDSTLMNVIRLCGLAIPAMQQRRWGRIVHITSFVAKQPTDLLTVSSTLRAGLSALTKTLADQVARDGITVNAVLPGHFLTDRQTHLAEIRATEQGITPEAYLEKAVSAIPVGRYGRPEELAAAIAFLCSERAAFITGSSVLVDGGQFRGTF